MPDDFIYPAAPVPAALEGPDVAYPAPRAAPAGPIALVDPETRALVGLDDPSQLPQLAELGYRPATVDEVQAHRLKEHYDTLGQAAAAAGEGALDTLIPVLGPLAERALGVSAEDQLIRAQFHPVARGLGQVAGAVGGAALGVGAPGLFAKAGGAVAGALGAGVLGGAAGEALQGFMYSASDVANRAVLGDPGLTAETALRQIGITTAVGAGLGGLGGLAKKFAADHADHWAGELKDFAADRTLKSLGGIQSDRNQLVKRYGEEGYRQIMREISEHPMRPVGPFSTAKTSFEVGESMQDSAWGAMKAEMAKAGQVGARISGDDLLQKFRAVVDEAQVNPFVPKSAISRLDGMLETFQKGFGGKALPVENVHELRKFLSKSIGYSRGAVDFDSNIAKSAMHDWRTAMSDAMDDAFAKSGVGSQAWTAANRQYQLGKIVQQTAQRGINRAEGNNIVSLTELLTGGVAALAGEGGEAASSITHILGRGLVGTAATALLRRQGSHVLAWAGVRASRALEGLAAGVETEVGQAVERAFAGAAGIGAVKASDLFTPENFAERTAEINRHLSEPEAMLGRLSDPTLDAFARPVMDQVRARVQSALATLGAGIPRYDVVGPLDPAYPPSRTELARLNRTAEVARDPLAVLARVSEGTILPDHVQALDAIWPAYASVIRVRAAKRLADAMAKGEKVSPRLRIGLALLLGQDLGRSTTGQAIAAAQSAYAARTPPQNAPPPPGSRASQRVRNVETKIGERAATSTDAAVEHLQRG